MENFGTNQRQMTRVIAYGTNFLVLDILQTLECGGLKAELGH